MGKSIKAGIVGAAGYTGGELVRLLLHHPFVEIIFCYSRTHAGKHIGKVHTDLTGESTLKFTNELNKNIDVVFICVPHAETSLFLENNAFPAHVKIIDLSNAFRLKESSNGFTYGLPELNREETRTASKIANPGCFATAIELALLPLAANGLLKSDIHISGITGSTGAGVSLNETSHFTWRNNNMAVYKPFSHQHLSEIKESLLQLQPADLGTIHFIPYRGDFTRGIIVTAYTEYSGSLDDARLLYKEYYKDEPFTLLSEENIDLKQIVNTNKCLLYLSKHDNHLMIVSVLDNLLKGASGQAVQNMNILFGFDESTGLKLKPSAY